MQLRRVLREAADALRAGGVETPRTDAELLLAHVLGVGRSRLYVIDEIEPEQVARYRDLIARRARREPLQHITGVAPFFGLELRVGPGVFIPRPETELLAQWGIEAVTKVDRPVVVDLCSGSGALALAVAYARPDAAVYAVERSAEAVAWLRRNAQGSQIEIVQSDIREEGLLTGVRGRVDLVLCNPPYVPAAAGVPAEVAADPPEAVFAGTDGLALIPAVAERGAALLRDGGQIGLEHDESHPDQVARIMARSFGEVRGMPDLTGRPRFTVAVKRPRAASEGVRPETVVTGRTVREGQWQDGSS